MPLENLIKKAKTGILLAGALFSLNSCNNFVMKGFDKIYKNGTAKEKLEISVFKGYLEYDKIKKINSEKGNIVFEYQTEENNSDIFMLKNKIIYQITKYSENDKEPQIKNEKIVFTREINGYPNIFLAELKNKELIKLTNDKRHNYSPSMDDLGAKIAFTRGLPEEAEVYLMDLEKNETANISNDEAGDYYSRISRDGNRIGFVSERKGSSVYIKDIKKDTLILAAQGYEIEYSDLRLNYDGTKIAYCGITSADKNGTIFFKDLNTGKNSSWPLNKGYDGEPSIDSAGNFISWISRQNHINERINKKLPFEDKISKRKKKIGRIDEKGKIHIENKKSKPKIKVADIRTRQVIEIENEISDEQMGNYISELSQNGKSLIILNEKNKENYYQIKNPMYYKEDPKYFLKEEKELWMVE